MSAVISWLPCKISLILAAGTWMACAKSAALSPNGYRYSSLMISATVGVLIDSVIFCLLKIISLVLFEPILPHPKQIFWNMHSVENPRHYSILTQQTFCKLATASTFLEEDLATKVFGRFLGERKPPWKLRAYSKRAFISFSSIILSAWCARRYLPCFITHNIIFCLFSPMACSILVPLGRLP
jgi:hypothetical protein